MTSQKSLQKFNELYEATYTQVLKYVICHCNNISDIEDILQNIYYAVYKQIHKISHESYVLGIAKNKVNEFYRWKYKQPTIVEDEIEIIDDSFDLSRDIQLQCDLDEIWDFLNSKSIIIAKVFYLYFYLELSIQEISNELNIPISNVKNYLYRTLKELRQNFESEDFK